MKHKRLFLSRILNRIGLTFLGNNLREPKLIIYNFHRIKKTEEIHTDFDDSIFGISEFRFEELLKTLIEISKPISSSEIMDLFLNKKKLTENSFAITFDDGYSDFYTVAWPILKKYNIKPILFISTEAIQNRKVWWWDLIAYLVKSSSLSHWEWKGVVYNLSTSRHQLIHLLQTEYKKGDSFLTQDRLESLAESLKAEWPHAQNQDEQLLTWEQIIEMKEEGVEIGAHGHRHDIFSTLGHGEQELDLKMCLEILTEKLGHAPHSLAWPVGGYPHYTEYSVNLAKNLGFKLIYSFETGGNFASKLDPYNIKRVNGNSPISLVKAEWAFPELFCRYFRKQQ